MGSGLFVAIAFAVILVIAVVVLGFALWRRFGSRHSPAADRGGEVPPTVVPGERLGPVGQALRRDAAAGRRDALLHRLDRDLPEWPAASTLIEAVRDLFALESDLDAARNAGVPDSITNPLIENVQGTADLLWQRADRMATVGSSAMISSQMREDLAQRDEQLVQLRQSIRDARVGLSELTLSGDELPNALRRAEGRFQVMADTARELSEFDRERIS